MFAPRKKPLSSPSGRERASRSLTQPPGSMSSSSVAHSISPFADLSAMTITAPFNIHSRPDCLLHYTSTAPPLHCKSYRILHLLIFVTLQFLARKSGLLMGCTLCGQCNIYLMR